MRPGRHGRRTPPRNAATASASSATQGHEAAPPPPAAGVTTTGAATTATVCVALAVAPRSSVIVSRTVKLPGAVGARFTLDALVALLKPATAPPPSTSTHCQAATVRPAASTALLPSTTPPPTVGVVAGATIDTAGPLASATAAPASSMPAPHRPVEQ